MKDIIMLIKKLNNLIKNNYSGYQGSYLYGSYARGVNGDLSDIDIAAIFKTPLPVNERLKLWEIISELEAEFGVVFDLHPISYDELKKNPVYYNQVVSKGIFYGI